MGFKGYGIPESDIKKSATFQYKGKEFTIKHGDVVIAAITSCTNTSNPNVLLGEYALPCAGQFMMLSVL